MKLPILTIGTLLWLATVGSQAPAVHYVCSSHRTTEIATGQIVDAVIMPVAPHAAVIPGKYYHTGEFPDLGLLRCLESMLTNIMAKHTLRPSTLWTVV